MDKLKKQMDFLIEIDKLKNIFRQSLVTESERHENDAEHSWHICMFAFILEEYAPEGTDLLRCIKMLLIHDLVEIYAGDTYLYDEKGYLDKQKREQEAAEKLFSVLDESQYSELKSLWYEFEESATKESKFANTMDRIQPVFLNYLSKGKMWKKNGIHKSQVISKGRIFSEDGEPRIKKFMLELIDECVEKGYLLQ